MNWEPFEMGIRFNHGIPLDTLTFRLGSVELGTFWIWNLLDWEYFESKSVELGICKIWNQ